jgi:hypothetical protein
LHERGIDCISIELLALQKNVLPIELGHQPLIFLAPQGCDLALKASRPRSLPPTSTSSNSFKEIGCRDQRPFSEPLERSHSIVEDPEKKSITESLLKGAETQNAVFDLSLTSTQKRVKFTNHFLSLLYQTRACNASQEETLHGN